MAVPNDALGASAVQPVQYAQRTDAAVRSTTGPLPIASLGTVIHPTPILGPGGATTIPVAAKPRYWWWGTRGVPWIRRWF